MITPCIEEGKGAMVLGGIHPECQTRFCTCVDTSVPRERIKKKEGYLSRGTVDWHLGRVKRIGSLHEGTSLCEADTMTPLKSGTEGK